MLSPISPAARRLSERMGLDARAVQDDRERIRRLEEAETAKVRYRRPPQFHRNTKLARQVAVAYEAIIGPFPGGIRNAAIHRSYAGHIQRSQGALSWRIMPIHRPAEIVLFGSFYPATQAARDWGLLCWQVYLGSFPTVQQLGDLLADEVMLLAQRYGDRVKIR